MTIKKRLGACGLLLVSLLVGCSDDGEEKETGKSWQCDGSQEIAACTCYYDEPINFANPVAECTKAIGNAARCCKSGAGAATPNCVCASGNDVGCPAGYQEVEKCSGLPPE
jgi:hypothetical protein